MNLLCGAFLVEIEVIMNNPFSLSTQTLCPVILGCNITGPSEEDHVQREIEKEQIRQEILAAETLRRRELIAEVMQEMAVEREMAIRRVAETIGINQMKLPNQNQNQNQNNNLCRQNYSYRDPMMYTFPNYSLLTSSMMQMPVLESNNDKLIVLVSAFQLEQSGGLISISILFDFFIAE